MVGMVKMSVVAFRIVAPHRLAGGYQSSGRTYCLCLQSSIWRQYVPRKHWYPLASPHGITTQNTTFNKENEKYAFTYAI
jgi:hypothetical protein